MAECEKKKLQDLRVVDLRSELEKRELETSGVKTILIERLEKALRDEGENPEEYLFDVSKGKAAKAVTPSKNAAKDPEKPITPEKESTIEETKVEVIEEQQPTVAETENGNNNSAEIGEDELILKEDEYEEIDGLGNEGGESESKADTDNDANIEDSLNLTIGEEEEQLLREDDDIIKPKDTKTSDDTEQTSGEKGENMTSKTAQKVLSGGIEDLSTTSSATAAVSAASNSTSSTAAPTEKKKITAPSPTPPSTTSSTNSQSRNLWVSGLATVTRATDLKQIFSKHGKVVGAKIVTNTRSSNSRCFGYVTMATSNDATECIKHLHKTILHEKTISVERAKNDLNGGQSSVSSSKLTEKNPSKGGNDNKTSTSDKRGGKDNDLKKASTSSNSSRDNKDTRRDRKVSVASSDDKAKEKKSSADETKKSETRETSSTSSAAVKPERKPISPPRSSRSKSRDKRKASPIRRSRKSSPVAPAAAKRRSRSREILSFEKMKEERERERRMRERERELQNEERRRREIKRRHYEEEQRLIREREKLELEKIKIAKEKAELIRIQRERQKLELEKIELERLELKRQQRKIEEEKRAIKRPLSTDRYEDERSHKRPTNDRRGFEPPPPPRFDMNRTFDRASDRDRDHRSTSDIKKRLDDYPKRDEPSYSSSTSKSRDDGYKSRGDSYKTGGNSSNSVVGRGGVDYKREVEISRHSSSNYASSSRIDNSGSSTSMSKDRYAASTDYGRSSGGGSGAHRNDDSRNGSNKTSRFYDTQSDSRTHYERPQVSASAWTPTVPHSQFPSMNTGDIWSTKQQQQQQDTGNGWRGNIDDNRGDYSRFGSGRNDRKAPPPFIDSHGPRSNQYMGGGGSNANILQQSAQRFSNNPQW